MTLQDGLNTGNLLINNTILNATNLLYLDAGASSNTFCLNNFTSATTYVQDTNGSNFYNCTYDGKNQGNIYANVMNESVDIRGNVSSSISNLYIGFVGTGYPYSNTTSEGKFSCNFASCQDNAPLTPTLGFMGTLTITASPSNGGNYTGNSTNITVPATVQITATPNWKFIFSNWETTCVSIANSTSNETSIYMTGDCSATVNFNLTVMPNISVLTPLSWLAAYYTPGSILNVSWTNTSTIYGGIGYNVSLLEYGGAFNSTINGSTNETSLLWNSTGYDNLRYAAHVRACDSTGWCVNATGSYFGIYTPAVAINYSAYASPDQGTSANCVPHNYFKEYLDVSCYPGFTCTGGSYSILSFVGNVLASTAHNSTVNGNTTLYYHAGLDADIYYRTGNITNIYGNSSTTAVRTICLSGEPITAADISMTSSGGGGTGSVFAAVFLIAGWLIYQTLKKREGAPGGGPK